MADQVKPDHRSGYTSEDLEQARAALLTMGVTLGAYLGDLCIVGGLVPSLLIEPTGGSSPHDPHPGTNDLDVGLSIGLLNEERYTAISKRLRSEGFEAGANDAGNLTPQTWRHPRLRITIDFLVPQTSSQQERMRVQHLESDFGAFVIPGLDIAFDDLRPVELSGETLRGERASRTFQVCGPATFVVLKALAFGDRGEPKDAFDLVYVLRYSEGRGRAIADRLVQLRGAHGALIEHALNLLDRDFAELDNPGPRRSASFGVPRDADAGELDDAVADAHGFVAELLDRARERALLAG